MAEIGGDVLALERTGSGAARICREMHAAGRT
jgi:hypothetical protein